MMLSDSKTTGVVGKSTIKEENVDGTFPNKMSLGNDATTNEDALKINILSRDFDVTDRDLMSDETARVRLKESSHAIDSPK